MLLNYLAPREKASIATTKRELEAIFRFRYRVYLEKGLTFGGMDHERRMMCDEGDDSPFARHVYVGTPGAIKGACRVFIWGAGEVPPEYFVAYGMESFPNIDTLRTSHVGRLVIGRGVRGRLTLPSLADFVYDLVAGDERCDLNFSDCRPMLLQYYRRLGARPYGAPMRRVEVGLAIPLVSVLSDYDYFRSVGAITTSKVRKHFGRGKRPALDQSPFVHLFDDAHQRVQTSAKDVLAEIERLRTDTEPSLSNWMGALPPRVVKKLAALGFLLRLEAGDEIVKEGVCEGELYVITAGTAEVIHEALQLAILGAGSVIGEMAFFREAGLRTATVRALEDVRVLVLPYNFVEKIKKRDSKAACSIVQHLGQTVADRLHATNALYSCQVDLAAQAGAEPFNPSPN